MTQRFRSAERRARRSLWLYPEAWRRRFGDEFVALMEDDVAEHPQSPARTFNLIRTGLVARLADLGMVGRTLAAADQNRVAFATTIAFGLWFMPAAVGLWSISMLGWNGPEPGHPTTLAMTITTALMTVSMIVLTTMLGLSVLAVLASAVVRIVRGVGRHLITPTVG